MTSSEPRRRELAFTAHLLANAIRSIRLDGDRLTAHRRAICLQCAEHTQRGDELRCNACGCADPSKHRARCPVFKW